jgi:hypothetical protein
MKDDFGFRIVIFGFGFSVSEGDRDASVHGAREAPIPYFPSWF